MRSGAGLIRLVLGARQPVEKSLLSEPKKNSGSPSITCTSFHSWEGTVNEPEQLENGAWVLNELQKNEIEKH